MLSPSMLVPLFPARVENRDLGDRLELCSVDSESSRLCSVDSDSSGLCLVDSGSLWLVIIPKSKDQFIERPPMRTVQP
jgi:hypothetical protein